MHRRRATLFSAPPIRCKPDNESIELDVITSFIHDSSDDDISDLETSEEDDEEEDEDLTSKSFAFEYAYLTLEAAHNAVCESFAETRENAAGSHTRLDHFADRANNIMAAPFAYCPAFIIAVFAFLSGAALDVYAAIVRHLPDNSCEEPIEKTMNNRNH